MVTHFTNSELSTLSTTTTTTHSQKAWHFLALLLTMGRPTRPAELASKCTLFPASPEFVEFLCSIPNSPLFLTNDLFVTLSSIALFAFGQIMSNSFSIAAFAPQFEIGCFGPKRLWDGVGQMYFRKRKCTILDCEFMPMAKRRVILNRVDADEEDGTLLPFSSRIQNACTKVHFHVADDMSRSMNTQPGDMSVMAFDSSTLHNVMVMTPLLVNSNPGLLSHILQNFKHVEGEEETNVPVHRKVHGFVCRPECQHSFLNIETFPNMPNPITLERIMACELDSEPALLASKLENVVEWKEAKVDEINLRSRVNFDATSFWELDKQRNISPLEAGNLNSGCKATNVRIVETERIMEGREEEPSIDSGTPKREIENCVLTYNTAQMDMLPKNDSKRMNLVNCNDMMPSFNQKPTDVHRESQAIFPAELSVAQKKLERSSPKKKIVLGDALTPRLRALCKSVEYNNAVKAPKEQQKCRRDHKSNSMKQKLKQNCRNDMYIKDKRENSVSISPKNQPEPKELPNFESFIVEEEEGSGGYGTVYRARRKNDGITLAIKCPHANAHRHHVNNELRMLERFGGKNFIIKYEGSFKCGNSECFVLEHVEHDRPEVLKREIDVFQLQWYGYCMFRALASLHKQGIVHRDVKPGNFLFSRKVNKGYLIDFNLAMDLYQKYGTINKSKPFYDVSFDQVPLPHAKSVPPTKSGKFMNTKFSEAVNREAARGSKSTLEPKNLKKKAVNQTKAYAELGSCTIKSQGADGSGITSAKDVTSTRTPSAERLREPMPCQGRKELISLVQEAMQIPNEAVNVPVTKRKRVAATPGKVDRKLVYLSPMPLHSTGIAVSGAGLLKNKGDGKHKREGPCVGTKGFRAPEVLFRSPHQGPKVDIWSAGVTLLYLMIGRTPFVGDPEQNIKDIAKLRGSEDLWEVAKLHNRESSFPTDLFDIQSLPSTKLRNWCKENTKKPEFLEEVPRSLIDLVDKCLTVNPRLRISAEEALRHEFFAPCHEGLRKQKLLRQGLSLETGTSHLLHGQNVIRAVKISH